MIDRVRDAMRVLLASTIVQSCEVADENLARWLKESGADVIVASSGGNVPESKPQGGRMYQVPFAEQIRFDPRHADLFI